MAMSKDEFRTKVTTDPSFREELKKDPTSFMRSIGWDVAKGISYEVIELDDPTKEYLVLPPLQTDELTDEQLATAQGGGPVCTIAPPPPGHY